MIRARQLIKSYPPPPKSQDTSVEVLRGIDLEIPDGEFVALVGPSGSGKTTLLSLLAGLDRPSAGEIEIDGVRLDTLSEEALSRFRRGKLGFVFQSYHLLPSLTALENVALPLELRGHPSPKKTALEWLEKTGLKSRAHHYPSQLSGGEQQRVAVARALVAQPSVIFADEPTGNLDAENGEKVLDLLSSLRGRSTLVVVTHDSQVASKADRTLRLDSGRMVSSQ